MQGQDERQRDREGLPRRGGDHQRDQQQRHQAEHGGVWQRRPPREHQDEAEQIEDQRHHPEQRGGGNVGGDVGGDAEQQRGRHECQDGPGQALTQGQALAQAGGAGCLRADRVTAQGGKQVDGVLRLGLAGMAGTEDGCGGAQDQAERHDPEAAGPERRLQVERQHRLDQQRIGEQRQQAAGVAGGIEEIRVARGLVVQVGEPALQQRRGGRDGEHRQPHHQRQPDQQPERGRGARRRRARAQVERQGQRSQGQQHGDVHADLRRARQQAGQRMGVGVAEQQDGLEEHHAGAPHRRRAAEARQHHLGDHRLDHEHQAGAEEQRGGERGEGQWRAWQSGRARGWHSAMSPPIVQTDRKRPGARPSVLSQG